MRSVGAGAVVLVIIASVSCNKDVEPTGPQVTPRDTASTPTPTPPASGPPGGPTGVIAFVSTRSGNAEIYTANYDGTNLKQLTNDAATDDYPAWSPDGKRIAFVSLRGGSASYDIYTMDADGSNVIRRTYDGNNSDPAWSPDGRRIVFAAKRGERTLIHVVAVDDDWSNAKSIGFPNDQIEVQPAWLPDGKKVAFTSLGGDYTAGLFIANIDGSEIKPLLGSNGQGPIQYKQFWRTAWSPDGSRLAVVACDPFPCFDNGTIRVLKPDGTGSTNLKAVKFFPRLTWSPNGEWLAYSEGCAGANCARSITFMRSDGQDLRVAIADAYSPAWRPEPGALTTGPIKTAPPTVVASNAGIGSGKSFVSAASQTYTNAALITLRNRTANGGTVAASAVDGGFDPVGVSAQSGDEVVLSVLMRGADSAELMMVKVPPRRPPTVVRTSPSKGRTDVALNVMIEVVFTEPVNPLTVNSSTFGVFRGVSAVRGKVFVSADGLSVTFTPDDALERSTSYSIVMTTGIRDLDGDALDAQTSSTFTTGDPPLGTIAFVSDRDGNAEIYTINIDGTGLRRLTDNAARDVDPAWSPDGRFIAFSSDRDGSMKLYLMNADGSNVVRKTSGTGDNVAWSSDGKRIAYTGLSDQYCCAIRIADAAGDWSQSTRLSPDSTSASTHPSWSPDGKRIVFASDYHVLDGQQIFTMSSDGSDIRVLVKATANYSGYDVGEIYVQPSWSPDGNKVAVVACHFSPHNCYPYSTISIVNPDGSGLRVLSFAGGEARPTWSRDSQLIAFSSSSCWVCKRTIRYAYADGRAIENDVIVQDGYSPAWKP